MNEEGVSLQRLLELRQRLVKLAGIAQNLPAMHLRRTRQKAVPFERRPISQLFRFQIVGLLEIVKGLLVVLPRLGILTLVVQRLGRINLLGESRKA